MTSPKAVRNEYDARIRRAEKLIAEKSSASELLAFYKRIASFQKSFLADISDVGEHRPENRQFGSVRDSLDLTLVLPHFRNFLSLVVQNAPNALAAAGRELAALPSDSWTTLLSSYWELGGIFDQQIGAFAQFFPRAFLQPYAAYVAGRMALPPVLATPRVCPLCGGRALFGVLRIEGDGGKRCLVCSFCGYEWEFRRILCPTCGEEEEKKLPVYVAEQFPHIRVEACETCKFFVRTIDLTKDGHAVPVVDDLAAIPLTLWAHEHGYSRLQPNLLGS
ncbi:MAG TPA: formate dehydrogenase accessory protein FdhE [Verrucomicrobiae bacterium]|jgi:formate dehydrogenase accessory protein FdhE|nr:formate dehydrogenase accessory protein FdhE [Verrucomicrobiae bacterium]